MSLIQTLIEIQPRESGGRIASAAFSYQKNWALSHMMDCHKKEQNYAFAFEFHDDILVLDSDNSPTQAAFYQVKTSRKSNWTLKRLTKQETGKDRPKLSILGKLLQHRQDFKDHNVKLHFVTNANFSFETKEYITFAIDLVDKDKALLLGELKNQFPEINESFLRDLCFHKSHLSLEKQESHIKGEIHEFFHHYFGDDHQIPVDSWYKTISDDIRRKNDYPQSKIRSVSELIRNKCITKKEIDDLIEGIKLERRIKPNWEMVHAELKAQGVPFSELLMIKDGWRKYSAEVMNITNTVLKILVDTIGELISEIDVRKAKLIEVVDEVYEQIKSHGNLNTQIYKEFFIKAIIIWKYCEYVPIQETGSKPSAEDV